MNRAEEALRRMKAELQFGMRFMPYVTREIAYKQAFADLDGREPAYTVEEERQMAEASINKAREALLGSLLDCFGEW